MVVEQVVHRLDGVFLLFEREVRRQFVPPVGDVHHGPWREVSTLFVHRLRADSDDPYLVGFLLDVDASSEVSDGWILGEQAVPVVVAVDGDRLEQVRDGGGRDGCVRGFPRRGHVTERLWLLGRPDVVGGEHDELPTDDVDGPEEDGWRVSGFVRAVYVAVGQDGLSETVEAHVGHRIVVRTDLDRTELAQQSTGGQ